MKTWRNAVWLAGKDLRRTWVSYGVTGAAALLFGLFATILLDNLFENGVPNGTVDDWPVALSATVFFLAAVLGLPTNALSRDALRAWGEDAYSQRLMFLKSMPISVREIVTARLLTILLAAAVNVALFFLVPYLLMEELRGDLGTVQYLWFVATWTGLALLTMGWNFYLELGTTGKTYTIVITLLIPVLAITAIALVASGVSFVGLVVELARTAGATPAVVSLLVGVAGAVVSYRATVRRLERRDLAS